MTAAFVIGAVAGTLLDEVADSLPWSTAARAGAWTLWGVG